MVNRIKDWYNSQLLDFQNGFRKGHSTTDEVLITKITQLIAEKTNEAVYAIFVDLKAAFDHINRDWLFQTILNRFPVHNKSNKIIILLSALYQSATAELNNHPELKFDIKLGVRQGGQNHHFSSTYT